jgi:hypothetical protein
MCNFVRRRDNEVTVAFKKAPSQIKLIFIFSAYAEGNI